jgi:molybdopterin-binding protein
MRAGLASRPPGCDAVSAGHSIRGGPIKLSARNILKGKVIEVKKGATTAHVRIQLAGGAVVTSSITNEAVEELRLADGGILALATLLLSAGTAA